jgi:hypothetical protein
MQNNKKSCREKNYFFLIIEYFTHSPCSPRARDDDLAVSHFEKQLSLRVPTKGFLNEGGQRIKPVVAKFIQLVECPRTSNKHLRESNGKFSSWQRHTSYDLSNRFNKSARVKMGPCERTENLVAAQKFNVTKIEIESISPERNNWHKAVKFRRRKKQTENQQV